MYILKFTDKKRNEWCYYTKGSYYPISTTRDFVLKSYCFKSKNEVKRYIKRIIHAWWVRPGYKYSNFEILQVVISPDYIHIPKGKDYFMVVKK